MEFSEFLELLDAGLLSIATLLATEMASWMLWKAPAEEQIPNEGQQPLEEPPQVVVREVATQTAPPPAPQGDWGKCSRRLGPDRQTWCIGCQQKTGCTQYQ